MGRITGLAILLTLLAVLLVISMATGPYKGLGLGDAVSYLLGRYQGEGGGVLHYRLLRSMAAILAGAALAGSGASIQYILKNPLADPYLLGISSGAALGVLLLVYHTGSPPAYSVYGAAFAAGMAGFGLILGVAGMLGLSTTALIVAGVSISYLLGGASMIIITRLGDRLPGAFAWLFGTVAYVTSDMLLYTGVAAGIGVAGLALLSRRIGVLLVGEEMSRGMGVNVERVRLLTSILAALTASSVVAMAGPIGFIGLAGPWLARLLVGSWFPEVLAASLASGAVLTLFSDVSIRLIGGGELPLTAVSSLYGGAALFYLTIKTRRGL
ncbi:MAG: iron ABC transporter permease [Desulfurococcales archaeon]|nr:iron ABC transporter permease [Desulfurococcales archaeon]